MGMRTNPVSVNRGCHESVYPQTRALRPFPINRIARGTAEIELLLVIPILLTLLLLAAAGLKLGAARLANAFNAENNAYQQVTLGGNVQVAVNPAPLDGIALAQGVTFPPPPPPNHFDESLPTQTVAFPSGLVTLNSVSLSDQAVFLDPAWHYANWPQSDDHTVLQSWFVNDLAEDHPSDITDALGLQPAWPP